MTRREADPTPLVSVATQLGRSLDDLQQSLLRHLEQEARLERLVHSWERDWADRRARFARRMHQLESQLERFVEVRDSTPRLTLVGAPYDGETLS